LVLRLVGRVGETGIDMHGDPVSIEHRIRRPRGRPKGAKDRYQRPARRPGIVPPAASSFLIDPGFDDLG